MVATKKKLEVQIYSPIQGKCQDRISKCSVHPRANIKFLITTCDIHSAQRRAVKKSSSISILLQGKTPEKHL
jgi:hypothetical protein